MPLQQGFRTQQVPALREEAGFLVWPARYASVAALRQESDRFTQTSHSG